ncbi:MAG: nicotinate-nucleotide adenylyltransferase [Bacteroidetes bacterium]|nr:MAG: nicotinate-nucleotide adenylyltransferase [Bacteroidota bacterium]REK00661.1 MAG: nicotinate-nucleotide adenylyltransferase [Bacteroidota bacterium]REK35217.1 MAG: nicotinate-nucleotide adenylyltransferase [Bacteroidota bacterium]REK48294.1 MAG: nicotinate-nucleotide adenylyltransferase [Bacteroidota bacterium]
MKIGLFFGSFNPVHNGHMVIGSYMAEFTDLDQVWFVVSPHNPHKLKQTLLQDHHRLALLKAAIGDNRKLKASDIEFKLPKPSYTVHTLAYLKEKFPSHQFALILGSDNLATFHKWKNYEQILEWHELYVYPRRNESESELASHPKVKMIEAPLMELSSTFIRNAIREKKDVRYMLPQNVWEYIDEMNFYRS